MFEWVNGYAIMISMVLVGLSLIFMSLIIIGYFYLKPSLLNVLRGLSSLLSYISHCLSSSMRFLFNVYSCVKALSLILAAGSFTAKKTSLW